MPTPLLRPGFSAFFLCHGLPEGPAHSEKERNNTEMVAKDMSEARQKTAIAALRKWKPGDHLPEGAEDAEVLRVSKKLVLWRGTALAALDRPLDKWEVLWFLAAHDGNLDSYIDAAEPGDRLALDCRVFFGRFPHGRLAPLAVRKVTRSSPHVKFGRFLDLRWKPYDLDPCSVIASNVMRGRSGVFSLLPPTAFEGGTAPRLGLSTQRKFKHGSDDAHIIGKLSIHTDSTHLEAGRAGIQRRLCADAAAAMVGASGLARTLFDAAALLAAINRAADAVRSPEWGASGTPTAEERAAGEAAVSAARARLATAEAAVASQATAVTPAAPGRGVGKDVWHIWEGWVCEITDAVKEILEVVGAPGQGG